MTKVPRVMIQIGDSRPIPEWVGKSPTAKIPDAVKLRIWRREDGKCYLSGAKIMPGDEYEFEHKIRLADGGRHAESNIFLALKQPHKEKSAKERDRAAKADAAAKKHVGIYRPKSSLSRVPREPKRDAKNTSAIGPSNFARRFGATS